MSALVMYDVNELLSGRTPTAPTERSGESSQLRPQ
jgi:hypothetical protein